MSDTPQTDAAVEAAILQDRNHPRIDWVPASFARELERERDEARELLASEKITRNHIIKRSVKVERERDEAREALRKAIRFVEAYEPHSRGVEVDQNETLNIIRKALEETK